MEFDVVCRSERLAPDLPWTCDNCDKTHDYLVRLGWPHEVEICCDCLSGAIDAINHERSKLA